MADKSSTKVSAKFLCMACDYCSSYQTNYAKHLLTAKHRMLTQMLSNVHANNTTVSKMRQHQMLTNMNVVVGKNIHRDKVYLDIEKPVYFYKKENSMRKLP